VLVTGCSSGIGRATAERLAGRGWTVYASARRPESIKDLADTDCKLLALDVTDQESRPRYRVTAGARMILVTRMVTTDRGWDRVVRTAYPPPKPE
jgi:NADP-dependent 3-hydroxy acid dehydrogenase YdfG